MFNRISFVTLTLKCAVQLKVNLRTLSTEGSDPRVVFTGLASEICIWTKIAVFNVVNVFLLFFHIKNNSCLTLLFKETSDQSSSLAAKLNQMQEIVRQKNKVELKLSQQLQEAKRALEKERKNFIVEMNEREARERALEVSKRQLETQLTAVDRENYESLEELSLLQVCGCEKMRRVVEVTRVDQRWLYCSGLWTTPEGP